LCLELGVDIFYDDIVRVVNEASIDDFVHVTRTALDFGHSTLDFEHQFSQRFLEAMNHPDFVKFPINILLRILKEVTYDVDLLLEFCIHVIETQGSSSSAILCIVNLSGLNQTHFDRLMVSDCVNLLFAPNVANFLLRSIPKLQRELQSLRNAHDQNHFELDNRLTEEMSSLRSECATQLQNHSTLADRVSAEIAEPECQNETRSGISNFEDQLDRLDHLIETLGREIATDRRSFRVTSAVIVVFITIIICKVSLYPLVQSSFPTRSELTNSLQSYVTKSEVAGSLVTRLEFNIATKHIVASLMLNDTVRTKMFVPSETGKGFLGWQRRNEEEFNRKVKVSQSSNELTHLIDPESTDWYGSGPSGRLGLRFDFGHVWTSMVL
jgi:hypothetical protein